MAYRDFLPSRESDLVGWAQNFGNRITATPTAFGLTAAQATGYNTLLGAFVTAWNVTRNHETRSGAAVIVKNQAKAALVKSARQLTGIIQTFPATTDEQRALLGITVPKSVISPVQPPTKPPVAEVERVEANKVWVTLHEQNSSRRGKPEHVASATVLSYVGNAPPANIDDWKFEGSTSRTSFELEFGNAQPFARVWITAFWATARGLSGPACTPISTNLGTWLVQNEEEDAQNLKKAA